MSQLTLDLGQRAALGRGDFLVAPSNETAVAWIDRWPDWLGPALVLYGPAGCGKTHLAQVWRAASGAIQIDSGALNVAGLPDVLGAARAVLLDGMGEAWDDERQEALLHLYNVMVERAGYLLFCGRKAPARWPVALADLRSRINAVQAVELGPPDDALIAALLVKLFADRQLRVGPEVIGFLLSRMERSFAAARDLVDTIDRAALRARREITVPLVRSVLQPNK